MDPLKIQIISDEERKYIERQLREEASTSLIQESENEFNFSSTIRNDKKENEIEHSDDVVSIITFLQSISLFDNCHLHIYQSVISNNCFAYISIRKENEEVLLEWISLFNDFEKSFRDQLLYIKKMEIVRRGLIPSDPLPPISRIEENHFDISDDFTFIEDDRRSFLISIFLQYHKQMDILFSSFLNSNEGMIIHPTQAFSSDSINQQFIRKLQYELSQFQAYTQSLLSMDSSRQKLLSTLSCYRDYLRLSAQLFILLVCIDPSFISVLPSFSPIWHSSFPTLPHGLPSHQVKQSPQLLSVKDSSPLKRKILETLELCYLYIDSLEEENVQEEQTLRVLGSQWSHIQSLLQTQKKEEKCVSHSSDKPSEMTVECIQPVQREDSSEENVCYIYQGMARERRERKEGIKPNVISNAFIHELKAVLASRPVPTNQYKTVIVGEEMEEVDDSQKETPIENHPQHSFFSLFSPKENYETIECISLLKQTHPKR